MNQSSNMQIRYLVILHVASQLLSRIILKLLVWYKLRPVGISTLDLDLARSLRESDATLFSLLVQLAAVDLQQVSTIVPVHEWRHHWSTSSPSPCSSSIVLATKLSRVSCSAMTAAVAISTSSISSAVPFLSVMIIPSASLCEHIKAVP